MIKRDQFIQILKENEEDYERFCMIKDQILLNSDHSLIKILCSYCRSQEHIVKNCPRLHFLPDFEKVIKRQEFYLEVPRANFKRRNYCRFLKSKVTQEAEKFNLDEEKLRKSIMSQNSSQPSMENVSLNFEMQPPPNEMQEIKRDSWVINNEKETDFELAKKNELEKNYEFGMNAINQDKGLEIHLMKFEENHELTSMPKSPKSPSKNFAPLWEFNLIKTWDSDIEQQPKKENKGEENHDWKQNALHSLKSIPKSPCSPTKKLPSQWEVHLGKTGESDQEQPRKEKSFLMFERMKNFKNYFPKMNCNEIILEMNRRAFYERLHRTGTQREQKNNLNLKKYTFSSQKILQMFREGNNAREKTPLAPLLKQRRRKITQYESFFERKNADHRKSFKSIVASILNQPYLNVEKKPISKNIVLKFKNILKSKSKFFK